LAAGLLALAAGAAGCTSDVCSRGSDCASGMVCSIAGQCIVPIDAAVVNGDGGAVTADASPTKPADAATDASTDGGM
jgi:hypothetical protein